MIGEVTQCHEAGEPLRQPALQPRSPVRAVRIGNRRIVESPTLSARLYSGATHIVLSSYGGQLSALLLTEQSSFYIRHSFRPNFLPTLPARMDEVHS